ncbi:MAG: diacylglycerol/polyprenol kinase family protein [Promethearchaeota archaeon]
MLGLDVLPVLLSIWHIVASIMFGVIGDILIIMSISLYRQGFAQDVPSTISAASVLLVLCFMFVLSPPLPEALTGTLLAWCAAVIIYYVICFRRSSEKHEKTTNPTPAVTPLTQHLLRKSFHALVLVIPLVYIYLGDYIFKLLQLTGLPEEIIGEIGLDPGRFFSILVMSCAFVFISISETIRVFAKKHYPFAEISHRTLKPEEGRTIAHHFHFSLGVFLILTLLQGQIALATIMMASFGDAAASLAGLTIGKHRIQDKSVEGFVAGSTVSFLIGLPFVSILLCMIGSFVELIIDIASLPISDNLLNPVLIGTTMTVTALLL